ncbi:MAG: hypothetical protein COB66_07665 [Coxiella sp. (in: Bacteria)]|nr:MAG: hypothetical protein COB66_07665 [Coxiella sp. (in: g-proteobacteria)]
MDDFQFDNISQFLRTENIGELLSEFNTDEINLLFDKLRQHNNHLVELANRDALTGLPNRYYLETALKRLIAQSKRRKQKIAILFLDLDGFKAVNDQHGHAMGDAILMRVAEVLKQVTREEDLVARLGGDEFVIILPCIKQYTDGGRIARKIINEIQAISLPKFADVKVGASIGIAGYPIAGQSGSDLLHHADLALYRAKDKGTGQIEYHSETINEEFNYKEKAMQSLAKMMRKKQLSLNYTPIYKVGSSQVTAVQVSVIKAPYEQYHFSISDLFFSDLNDSKLQTEFGVHYFNKIYRMYSGDAKQAVGANLHRQLFIEINRAMLFNRSCHKLLKSLFAKDENFKKIAILSLASVELDSATQAVLIKYRELGIKICLICNDKQELDLSRYHEFIPDYIGFNLSIIAAFQPNYVTALVAFSHSLGMKVLISDIKTRAGVEFAMTHDVDYISGDVVPLPLSNTSL